MNQKKTAQLGDWITYIDKIKTLQISTKNQLFKCRKEVELWRYADQQEIDDQKILDAMHYGMEAGYSKCSSEIKQFLNSRKTQLNPPTTIENDSKESVIPIWLMEFISTKLK